MSDYVGIVTILTTVFRAIISHLTSMFKHGFIHPSENGHKSDSISCTSGQGWATVGITGMDSPQAQ